MDSRPLTKGQKEDWTQEFNKHAKGYPNKEIHNSVILSKNAIMPHISLTITDALRKFGGRFPKDMISDFATIIPKYSLAACQNIYFRVRQYP